MTAIRKDMDFDLPTVHPPSEVAEHHKPGLRSLLRTIGMDVAYERATGDLLYYRDADNRNVEILDLVGGYGTLLLGHNHPELIAESARFFASGRPNHTQGSARSGAEGLAQALSARLGDDFCAVFANSGAEAIEAAIKHALLETGGNTLIVLEGAFHGKTAGALQLTSNPRFREPFQSGGLSIIRLPPNDMEQLRAAFAQCDDAAGFVFEPIQGEAGVRPLTAEFVQLAAQLCAERDIPLIADECQTGMGRTGVFLASHALGVCPDYIVLSKMLGGGIAKISALLIKRPRYQRAFDLLHSSTFADDEYSCAIALKTLQLLDAATLQNCRTQGEYLRDGLHTLMQRFPSVIADVRGAGLLIGVQLQRPAGNSAFFFNFLAERDLLGPMVSGYLLREHRIRIAPTLSDSFTLRIQPSALITRGQIDAFIAALSDVCEKIQAGDVCGLTRFLSGTANVVASVPRFSNTDAGVITFRAPEFWRKERTYRRRPSIGRRRVAWIFHLIDEDDLGHLEPAFDELTSAERGEFLERFAPAAEPVVMDVVDLHSAVGANVLLYPIVLPVTSAWLLRSGRSKGDAARELIQRAVDTAMQLNCDVVSLGQFTSMVTRNGWSLQGHNAYISTGNNYTVALVVESIRRELARRELDARDLTLAIVGAAGDIGHTCATMLAPQFRRSILVGSGRAGSQFRLNRLASRLASSEPATEYASIGCADVVVCATNCITAPLGPEHLHPHAIVCDVSVPPTLQPHTAAVLPDCTILPGAVAKLPLSEELCIPGFPLPGGYTYGCMAEGLLLGLEGISPRAWRGRSCPKHAMQIAEIAARHGFTLANSDYLDSPRTTCHVRFD